MSEKEITSEWTGRKGRIGGRFLNSALRRLLEILVWGDCRSVLLDEVSGFIPKGDEIVLDVGAGSGYFSLPIAEKLNAGKVICLDLSEEMLGHLERKAKKEGLEDRVQILNVEASSSGLEDGSVDLAVSGGVFHELSSPETVLTEMARVVKPGGGVIVADFRDTWLGRRFCAPHGEDAHGPFSVNELEALFARDGLSGVKVSPVRHWVIGVGKK
ncbi:MAG: class I SAM-dependent methyltransferase [Candidatus Hydrothermarchaeales archaeon]